MKPPASERGAGVSPRAASKQQMEPRVIVEMRTYDYRPGTVPMALERIALGLDERTTLSPLAGLWQTETGRLHRIVHLWPFRDLADRDHVRGRFRELKNWPARTGAWMVAAENKILIPMPFNPPLTPRAAGPVYEICTDTYHSGQLGEIQAHWTKALEERPSPSFIGAWRTELGPMNQWIHIWAFASLEQRAARRHEVVPLAGETEALSSLFATQDSVLCRPAAFSPLH